MMLAALALALQPPPASYVPPPRQHMGNHSCEDWTSARRAGRRAARAMEEFVWGFLTAFDLYGPRSSRKATADLRASIWGELDAYCAARPTAMFSEPVRLLVDPSRRRR